MPKPSLRSALDAGRFVVAPGVHDMIAAVVFNKVGFDFAYASGYWLTASAYGLPDAGIATYSQMVDRVATLCRTIDAGVIADADTGYGGLLNVHHTVRGYEEAGVTAIHQETVLFDELTVAEKIWLGHAPRGCFGVLLRLLTSGLGLLKHGEHSLAAVSGRAESAALDQRLDRALVDSTRVDAFAELPQRSERPVRTRRLDRLDSRVADALDGIEAESDVALGDDEGVI